MSYLYFLWPGTNGILRYGRWSFLAIALVYGLVLCGVMIVNLYWSELLTGTLRWASYGVLGIVWIVLSSKEWRQEKLCKKQRSQPDPKKDLFPEAQQHYLQGNWFEAECCLKMLQQKNPRDIEAMLMLATLYRHKARYDEAASLLRILELMEDAAVWKHEIRTEKRKLLAMTSQQSKERSASAEQNTSSNEEEEETEIENADYANDYQQARAA